MLPMDVASQQYLRVYWRICVYVNARGPLILAHRQSKTCCKHPFVSISVVTRLSRHNVVAPTLAAPLMTDTRRSTVGSGTREDIVTESDEFMTHCTFSAFSVPDMYVAIQTPVNPTPTEIT